MRLEKAVHFSPHRITAKKNKVCQKYQNSIRWDPYELGQSVFWGVVVVVVGRGGGLVIHTL